MSPDLLAEIVPSSKKNGSTTRMIFEKCERVILFVKLCAYHEQANLASTLCRHVTQKRSMWTQWCILPIKSKISLIWARGPSRCLLWASLKKLNVLGMKICTWAQWQRGHMKGQRWTWRMHLTEEIRMKRGRQLTHFAVVSFTVIFNVNCKRAHNRAWRVMCRTIRMAL